MLAQYELEELPIAPPAGGSGGIALTQQVSADFDVLLLDSYALEQGYIDALKRRPCRLALIDDDQRHDLTDADLVICFRAGAEATDYRARRQLLGPSFLLAKPEFRALRMRNLALPLDRSVRRALVFMSGIGGNTAVLSLMLQALDQLDVEVDCIAATLPPGHPTRVRRIALTSHIESVYADSDLVICGGGLTKYESAYCGIANACLSLTALQQDDTRTMAELGFTLDLGLATEANPVALESKISAFIRNPTALANQRMAFASKLDGAAPQRVAKILLAL